MKERSLFECKKFKPNETGGILIGVCNYKTKTIHLFDFINAPACNKRTPVSFTRGNIGLPPLVDQIKARTEGIIGYVGECHTHPIWQLFTDIRYCA